MIIAYENVSQKSINCLLNKGYDVFLLETPFIQPSPPPSDPHNASHDIYS